MDVAGPLAAFDLARRYRPCAYSVRVTAATSGPVRSSAWVSLPAEGFSGGGATPLDTLIVAGGEGTRAALRCTTTLRYLESRAAKARRVVSICSGSFLLAEVGLLDGRRATTHWGAARDFAQRYPRVLLEPDRIFVRDGSIWTSAGITAGIDLALALIGEDLGEGVARLTARQLVVYFRRPGGQSQFSALLDYAPAENRFSALLDYLRGHLHEPLSVDRLAARAAMSPRHFSRVFRAEIGATPAKVVQRLRAEAARTALENGARSVEEVAREAGFSDPERMRRTLRRLFGASPSIWKRGVGRGTRRRPG